MTFFNLKTGVNIIQSVSINVNIELKTLACAHCGLQFAVTSDFMRCRREDHESFYCPTGHSNIYTGENKAEKLERQLKFEKTRREQAEQEAEKQKKISSAQKAENTRLKNRVKHGVCPCCNRTFKQLARHMKNKHPEYEV